MTNAMSTYQVDAFAPAGAETANMNINVRIPAYIKAARREIIDREIYLKTTAEELKTLKDRELFCALNQMEDARNIITRNEGTVARWFIREMEDAL